MNTTIELINNLYIKVDSLNYTVFQRTNKFDSDGKMIPKVVGYASSFGAALNVALIYCTRNDLLEGVSSLREALETVKKYKSELIDAAHKCNL